MLNPFKEVNWSPGLKERRAFAKSLMIGFPCLALLIVVAGYFKGKGWNVPLAVAIGGCGVAAGLLFYTAPAIARPFYVAWYALACVIGLVVGNALLAIVYYVLITGLGVVLRTCGHRPVRKSVTREAATYWMDADQPSDPKRYYRQF